MELIFIGVVAAIVVAVAKPVRLNADGRGFALHVSAWTGQVSSGALVDSFVGRLVVLAVVDAVANLRLRNTSEKNNMKNVQTVFPCSFLSVDKRLNSLQFFFL